MYRLLSVLLLWSSALIGTTMAACSWKQSPGKIPFGTLANGVNTVDGCKATCLSTTGCQSVDFNNNNECYLLFTQSGVVPSTTVTHYDYVCADPCSPNPCQNGAMCSSSSSGYTCSCSNGYTGTNCETAPRDPCSPNPCQNGGQCSPSSSSYMCTCTSAYSGTNCETPKCRKQDIIKNGNIGNAITTNYDGNPSDVLYFPYGNYWTVTVPSFVIPWPNNFLSQPPSEVRYATTNNVDYLIVEITDKNGNAVTSAPCTASPCTLTKSSSVMKVTIYLAPKDFRTNVSVTGLEVWGCLIPVPILGCLSSSNIFLNPLFQVLNIVTLGLFNLDKSTGRIKYSGKTELPFVEINLETLGLGVSEFSRVQLTQCNNVKYGYVTIWENDYPVSIRNSKDVVSPYFGVDPVTNSNFAIDFASGMQGDRIRVEIVPGPNSDRSTTTRFRYQALSILIC